jgi:hypothetical protein
VALHWREWNGYALAGCQRAGGDAAARRGGVAVRIEEEPRSAIMPLDARSSIAVGGLLTVLASYALGVVAVPAALYLLRDRVRRGTVIWGSLASACVAGALALGPAWQWWRTSGYVLSSYAGASLFDPNTLSLVLPLMAALVVLLLGIRALIQRPPEDDAYEAPAHPHVRRTFATTDYVVMVATLAYLLAVESSWLFV